MNWDTAPFFRARVALTSSGLDLAFIDLSKRMGSSFGYTKVSRHF
jgi:hypothetical protein